MTVKNWFAKSKKHLKAWLQRPDKVYLIVALLGVIGFMLVTPPFQGPDEEAHYIRAQYIAKGYLIPVDVNKTDAELPASIDDVLHITFYEDDIRGRTNFTYEHSRTKAALKIPFKSYDAYKPQMINYSPLPYLPAIPGVAISNLMNLSPLTSLYVARLLLAVSSVMIIFLAIRIIPYKKYLLAVTALVPMMLFQQSVVTADSVSYALIALFISYVLYLREKTGITSKQWVILGATCLAVTLAKPPVFLFLPLILLVGIKKINLAWIGGIAAVCVVALLGWMLATSTRTDVVLSSGMPQGVNGARQLEGITQDPKRGLRVLWNSYMTPYGDDEIRGVVGVFGNADTAYPLWMAMAYVVLIGAVGILRFKDDKVANISLGWKSISALLCAIYFLAVNLALYMAFTPVNFDIFYGVQGRYFLPIIIIVSTIMLTGGVAISYRDTIKVKARVGVAASVLIALALFVTYQRYYLYTP